MLGSFFEFIWEISRFLHFTMQVLHGRHFEWRICKKSDEFLFSTKLNAWNPLKLDSQSANINLSHPQYSLGTTLNHNMVYIAHKALQLHALKNSMNYSKFSSFSHNNTFSVKGFRCSHILFIYVSFFLLVPFLLKFITYIKHKGKNP